MQIGIIGINHKSADLRLREKLAQIAEYLFGPQHSSYCHFSWVLLSTCNRTEIYFHSDNLAETHTYLLQAMRERVVEEFEHRIYSYFGSDCFFHLARVTAGIDSALIGETEIQGQVKRAYERAHLYQPLAHELHFLFQKCLKIGKEVRSHNQLCKHLCSIEEAIVSVGEKIFHTLTDKKILFVGLSEINQKIFLKLKNLGCCNLFLCNRSYEKAKKIAAQEKLQLISWQKLTYWVDFDVAIFGTKCPDFLATRENFHSKAQCQLVIDLSVPRNVDPYLKRSVTLLNVDQLNRLIDRKRKAQALRLALFDTRELSHAVEKQLSVFHLKERARHLLTAV